MLVKNAIFSLFGGGGIGPKEFGESIIAISDSINTAGDKLSNGNFSGGPSVKWASGIAIAMGAFGQVYKMLVEGAVMDAFGIGGVSPKSFSEAIVTISQGITDSAAYFAKGTTSYKNGPTKEWAEGVSLALGGFAPIYKMLVAEKIMNIFGKGVSVESFKAAIISISQGITTAAGEFAKPEAQVAYKNGPKKEWAEGVSAALQGFTGIFQALNSSSGWFTGKLEPDDYKNAIKSTGEGLVAAAKAIGGEGVVYDISKVPGKDWGDKITGAFMAFIPALKYINEQSGWFSNGAEDTVTNMAAISLAIKDASITLALGNYTTNIDPKWSNGVKLLVNNFLGILKMMSEQDFDYDDEYAHLKSSSNVIVAVSNILNRGKYVEMPKAYMNSLKSNVTIFMSILQNVGKSDVDKDKLTKTEELSKSLQKISLILSKGNFDKVIPKAWMDSIRTNLGSFSQMIKSFDSGGLFNIFSDSTSEKVAELANGIIELAKIFNENKVPFDVKKVPSQQWSQGFSTAMNAIMPGLNYISENSGLLSNGEEKFKSGVGAIADSIVSVSRKLATGRFDKVLNPAYFKNLSDSVNTYINITKSLEEADADYESISDMADSMVELAKAYDRLSEALTNLNGQLGSVDMERMTMLKNLSGSIVMLSLMDSAQFESMMTALESKAKIFVDLMKDTESSAQAGMEKTTAKPTEVKAGTKAGAAPAVKSPTTGGKKESSEQIMTDLKNAISSLNSSVGAIVGVIVGGGDGQVSLKEYMAWKTKGEKDKSLF
jgi:hypothetical protein